MTDIRDERLELAIARAVANFMKALLIGVDDTGAIVSQPSVQQDPPKTRDHNSQRNAVRDTANPLRSPGVLGSVTPARRS